jgi:hypothetical protein
MTPIRHMRYTELAARKTELEKILDVLMNNTEDDVRRELNEINYLMAPRRNE